MCRSVFIVNLVVIMQLKVRIARECVEHFMQAFEQLTEYNTAERGIMDIVRVKTSLWL